MSTPQYPTQGSPSANTGKPTAPIPEPEDVDELLSESLRAETEDAFSWKEPEPRMRWWERAEQQGTLQPASTSQQPAAEAHREERGVRLGSVIFGGVCLLLALWVLTTVVFGLVVDPIVVALAVCTLAGLTLVAAGLRPKPGRRI